ncbi:hypothetical protein [Streptomyces indiaensis]|uniref:hypothetical protein n=2 Tax=Streptomyces indiaensis TaxID=284033 RepID=UPI001F462A68|nr:hypothetical protein [Streptomyces indiaensis]MCF1648621.1 hypothetical protein [Streptomyces indiaensis]
MASRSGADRSGRLLNAVSALAELPLARACGLSPALAEDLTVLAAGHAPRLRVALSGPEPAIRPLAAALHRGLPPDVVRLDARPVDGHLLLHVVRDERTPSVAGAGGGDSDVPDAHLSEVLVRPGAPRASVVVVAEDDWDGLGLDSVAGWNADRLWSWPRPWHTVAVRAVVPRWALTRPQRAGLDVLLREELVPALDGRHALTAAVTRTRLARALRLLDATARDVTAAEPAAVTAADSWLRLQARAGGRPARRLSRLLDGWPAGPVTAGSSPDGGALPDTNTFPGISSPPGAGQDTADAAGPDVRDGEVS